MYDYPKDMFHNASGQNALINKSKKLDCVGSHVVNKEGLTAIVMSVYLGEK